jgi:ABC-type Fe3+-hydroxamate transport system, periplasmic component
MNLTKPLYLLLVGVVIALLSWTAAAQQNARLQPGPAGLPSVKPQRIVSMSPGNTEILFALGAGDRVVGVASYSDYPEEAKSKPTIGGYHAPDVEKIVALAPDIVFAMGEVQAHYIQVLEQAGITVVAVEPKTMPEILTAIEAIGNAIGEQERACALCAELAGRLDAVQRLTVQTPPKRVFLEVWDSPLLTVGRRSFINDIITQAGGLNVAAGKDADYTPCDLETLYAYNPEVYVIISHSRGDMRSLVARPELADIAAVKNGQVFQLVDDVLARPSPRSFAGLVDLAEILHPETMDGWRKE